MANPLVSRYVSRMYGLMLLGLYVLVSWILCSAYTGMGAGRALAASVSYAAAVSISALLYYYWAVKISVVRKVLAGVCVQVACVLFTMMTVSLFGIDRQAYSMVLGAAPLLILSGSFLWYLADRYYVSVAGREADLRQADGPQAGSVVVNSMEAAEQEPAGPSPLPEKERPVEKIARISVKKGAGMHIIDIDSISHISSCGDYAKLHTPEGKFLKELTMKYLEEHLPSCFVRVHRSAIVNADLISRIELHGKETYNLYLRNGAVVKTSTSGYKLLKDRLGL